jgi:hypothetical protein
MGHDRGAWVRTIFSWDSIILESQKSLRPLTQQTSSQYSLICHGFGEYYLVWPNRVDFGITPPFQMNILPSILGWRMQGWKQQETGNSSFDLTTRIGNGGSIFLWNVCVSVGLHRMMFQKTALFTVTAVRTLNPTEFHFFLSQFLTLYLEMSKHCQSPKHTPLTDAWHL